VIVGSYSLGFTVIQTPMNFIGGSISQVFFQRASEAKAEGTLDQLVEKVLRLYITIGMFPFLLLMFIGRDLFTIVFGEIWAEAGTFTQILSVWAFIWFLSSPLHSLFNVLEKQDIGLKFNIANFSARFAALSIGGVLGSPVIAISLFAISGIVVYGYVTGLLLVYSGVHVSRVQGHILSSLALFIPAGVIIGVLKFAGVNSWAVIILSALFCMAYYLYTFRVKKVEMI
jgi:O-antigen/teichoic acid export membrane protein